MDDRLHGHLEGHDPAVVPTFKWPEHLDKAHEKTMCEVRERGETSETTVACLGFPPQ